MTISMAYRLTYTVEAPTANAAIIKASALLRSVVTVEKVTFEQPFPGWYAVTFDVVESNQPEYADPITAAKAEADRVR